MTIATTGPTELDLAPVVGRVTKDATAAATTMSADEARYLVDLYYQWQENRKRAANQLRAASDDGEPNAALAWVTEQCTAIEARVRSMLGQYARSQPIGRWSMSIVGIGPVIAAGLMSHIDIDKAPTVSHIYRFAGITPDARWEKGQKRPWNADLKTLCWKIGESFVKVSGRDDDFYGKLYVQRKEVELRRNEAGELADQAAEKLERFKIGKTTKAYGDYSAGRLPPAHIHARAKRWAVKLFLSHWHTMAIRYAGREAPRPFSVAHLDHVHEIEPPNQNVE